MSLKTFDKNLGAVGIDYRPTITWKGTTWRGTSKKGYLTEIITWADGRTVEISAEDVPEDMTMEDYCDRIKETIDQTGVIFNGQRGGRVILKDGIVEAKGTYISSVDPHDTGLSSTKGAVVIKRRRYGLRRME